MASAPFFAVVAGAGPGTGRAVALKFAKTYAVVVLARSPESYNDTVAEIKKAGGHALGISTDVADAASVNSAFETIKKELPGSKLAAAIFNVSGGFAKKPFLELKPEELDDSLDVAVRGFARFAQSSLPLLLESVPDSPHPPSLLLTGATASVKGSAHFGSFAAGKFALRALGQSLAREFGPQGVHVAHIIVDGIIDIPRTKHLNPPSGAEDAKLKPEAIAESYWHLHTQHRSAFTQEIDIRPYVEKW
ncbi:short chain dehydrogenase [Dactylonectria estremocensis]|uniref:Short chain dehydrogenase n=1 Tax=Dactylonectria estremocensis TaxID=1079267 RepID=A0A9P9F454_9HYPO|nr:short chain dehydrogenase [Dactylonectria estremocensis]